MRLLFHVTHVLRDQTVRSLFEGIMHAWIKWVGAPRFLMVDSHQSHIARCFVDQLGALGTIVLVGAADPSRTRGRVEGHDSYVRTRAEKMVQDGVPDSHGNWRKERSEPTSWLHSCAVCVGATTTRS